MPTIDDITKVLSDMDENTYSEAVRIIYYLASSSNTPKNERMKRQRQFVDETAGKIQVDEDAIMELRMRSMI